MLIQVCSWLERNPYLVKINQSTSGSIILSLAHFFGMFLLVGSIAIVDLRVLGLVGKRENVRQFSEQFWPLVWIGLCSAVLSGFIMSAPDASATYFVTMFRVKLSLILAATLVGILVQLKVPQWSRHPETPSGAKLVALVSLILWLGAIFAAVKVPVVFPNPSL